MKKVLYLAVALCSATATPICAHEETITKEAENAVSTKDYQKILKYTCIAATGTAIISGITWFITKKQQPAPSILQETLITGKLFLDFIANNNPSSKLHDLLHKDALMRGINSPAYPRNLSTALPEFKSSYTSTAFALTGLASAALALISFSEYLKN